jgi:hypothetical protein
MKSTREFSSLPSAVQDSIRAWVAAVQAADEQAAEVIDIAREQGVALYDARALARQKLVASYRRTNANPAVGDRRV